MCHCRVKIFTCGHREEDIHRCDLAAKNVRPNRHCFRRPWFSFVDVPYDCPECQEGQRPLAAGSSLQPGLLWQPSLGDGQRQKQQVQQQEQHVDVIGDGDEAEEDADADDAAQGAQGSAPADPQQQHHSQQPAPLSNAPSSGIAPAVANTTVTVTAAPVTVALVTTVPITTAGDPDDGWEDLGEESENIPAHSSLPSQPGPAEQRSSPWSIRSMLPSRWRGYSVGGKSRGRGCLKKSAY